MDPSKTNAQPLDSAMHPLAQPTPHGIRNVFIGPNGIRAGWRLAIFIVSLGVVAYLTYGAVSLIPGGRAFLASQRNVAVLTPKFQLASEGILLFCVLLSSWIMSRIERRPFGAYGLASSQAFRKHREVELAVVETCWKAGARGVSFWPWPWRERTAFFRNRLNRIHATTTWTPRCVPEI